MSGELPPANRGFALILIHKLFYPQITQIDAD